MRPRLEKNTPASSRGERRAARRVRLVVVADASASAAVRVPAVVVRVAAAGVVRLVAALVALVVQPSRPAVRSRARSAREERRERRRQPRIRARVAAGTASQRLERDPREPRARGRERTQRVHVALSAEQDERQRAPAVRRREREVHDLRPQRVRRRLFRLRLAAPGVQPVRRLGIRDIRRRVEDAERPVGEQKHQVPVGVGVPLRAQHAAGVVRRERLLQKRDARAPRVVWVVASVWTARRARPQAHHRQRAARGRERLVRRGSRGGRTRGVPQAADRGEATGRGHAQRSRLEVDRRVRPERLDGVADPIAPAVRGERRGVARVHGAPRGGVDVSRRRRAHGPVRAERVQSPAPVLAQHARRGGQRRVDLLTARADAMRQKRLQRVACLSRSGDGGRRRASSPPRTHARPRLARARRAKETWGSEPRTVNGPVTASAGVARALACRDRQRASRFEPRYDFGDALGVLLLAVRRELLARDDPVVRARLRWEQTHGSKHLAVQGKTAARHAPAALMTPRTLLFGRRTRTSHESFSKHAFTDEIRAFGQYGDAPRGRAAVASPAGEDVHRR